MNKINRFSIVFEAIISHGDDLQRGLPTFFEPPKNRTEIGGPIFFSNGLKHLNAGDAVIDPGLIAIILQFERHHILQARSGNPIFGIFKLLLADGQTGHLQAALFCSIFGKAAPTTTDFQHMIAGFYPHLINHAGIFCCLSLLERFMPTGKNRR